MIRAYGLTKRFGPVTAASGISLTAVNGRITGLLGPNGAGKSTTLRMLYTALTPDAGEARIDGIDVVKDPLGARARLGVLPHDAGLYPQLTARENVAYYGRLCGLAGRKLAHRLDELTELLGMAEFEHRRTQGFSHGQRTRVALARALVHRPANLILDEPTTGLDVMAVRAVRTLLRHLSDQGICVLFSSHVMQEVEALCDELVIIAGGQIAAAGTPDALRAASGKNDLEDVFVQAIEASGSGDGDA
jgi:sodium transport system ATP-binding protein